MDSDDDEELDAGGKKIGAKKQKEEKRAMQEAMTDERMQAAPDIEQRASASKDKSNALHRQGRYAEAANKYRAARSMLAGQDSTTARQVSANCSLNLASCYLHTAQHDLAVAEWLAHSSVGLPPPVQRLRVAPVAPQHKRGGSRHSRRV